MTDFAQALTAVRTYMESPESNIDLYFEMLADAETDLREAGKSTDVLVEYRRAADQVRRELEFPNAWSLVRETTTGPVCGHCAYGRGRDRVTRRHADAEQVRRCHLIHEAQAAEALEERVAERAAERYYEERGAAV